MAFQAVLRENGLNAVLEVHGARLGEYRKDAGKEHRIGGGAHLEKKRVEIGSGVAGRAAVT
jgi:hypothetical protein